MKTKDEKYMARCIELAQNGLINAAPNPMVGAVIVYQDRIIGEGYHARCGEGHAEVNAVRSLHRTARLELMSSTPTAPTEEQIEAWIDQHCRQSTIYVSLEPCAHFGKTPPCADLLVSKHFKRCVIGCVDLFAKVSGRGIQKLKDAGIEVTVGVMEQECKQLNKRFFTFHSLKRPYIFLKWAQTADGYIDDLRTSAQTPSLHISTPLTQMRAHKLRAECNAILVGRVTAQLDRPSLNVRSWYGPTPLRIVLDKEGTVAADEQLFTHRRGTLFVQDQRINPSHELHASYTREDGAEVFCADFSHDILPQLMAELHRRNIQSLMVEGGTQLLDSMIQTDLWDEIHIEKSNLILGHEGVVAPTPPAQVIGQKNTFFGVEYVCFLR